MEVNSSPLTIQKCQYVKCKKKILPSQTIICQCSQTFCLWHRYKDVHKCTFNQKNKDDWCEKLRKENPVIKANKITKI